MEASKPVAKRSPIRFLLENQIYILLTGSVIIASILTSVSLWLYTATGTQQLDLSRPGYKSVRTKINRDPIAGEYSATGAMSLKEIDKFKKLLQAELDRANKNEAFSGDPLDPIGLGINLEDTLKSVEASF